jgi:hypothetical protein
MFNFLTVIYLPMDLTDVFFDTVPKDVAMQYHQTGLFLRVRVQTRPEEQPTTTVVVVNEVYADHVRMLDGRYSRGNHRRFSPFNVIQ